MKTIIKICLICFLSSQLIAQKETKITVKKLVKTSTSWDGATLPFYENGTPEITIVRIIIPPGEIIPLHKHTVINAGVLLRGELTVRTEEKKILHLKAGDPIVELVEKWHFGKNEGNTEAEIIVFYAGITDMEITVKK